MTFLLTLDCDWAPDFILQEIADILSSKKIKTTWFITNEGSYLDLFRGNPFFELGIHSNFKPNSTHGKDVKSVLYHLKSLVPEAKTVRSHSLFQSSQILTEFSKFGLKNDVSLFLPKTSEIKFHYLKHIDLIRLPYFWEDDLEVLEGNRSYSFSDPPLHVNGLKIFNFHPIHIILNSNSLESYNKINKTIGLENLTPKNLEEFINTSSPGVGNFFEEFIEYLSKTKSYTINEYVISHLDQ